MSECSALEVAIIKAVKDITLDFVWSGSGGGDSGSVWVHSGVFEVVVVVVVVIVAVWVHSGVFEVVVVVVVVVIVAVRESTVVRLKW